MWEWGGVAVGVGRDHISNSGARLLKMGGVGEAEGVANDAVELLSLWKTRHRVSFREQERGKGLAGARVASGE